MAQMNIGEINQLTQMYLQMGIPRDMIQSLVQPGMSAQNASALFDSVSQQAKAGVPPYNMQIQGKNISNSTNQTNGATAYGAGANQRSQPNRIIQQEAQSPAVHAMNQPIGSGVNPSNMAYGSVTGTNGLAQAQQAPGMTSIYAGQSGVPNMSPGQANYGLPAGSLAGQEILATNSGQQVQQAVQSQPSVKSVPIASNPYGQKTQGQYNKNAANDAIYGGHGAGLTTDDSFLYNGGNSLAQPSGLMNNSANNVLDTVNGAGTAGQWNFDASGKSLAGNGAYGADGKVVNPTGGGTDWGMKGMGGTMLGVGQLALGALSYFDQKKTQKKQRALMDQQIASNEYSLGQKKKSDAAWATTQF